MSLVREHRRWGRHIDQDHRRPALAGVLHAFLVDPVLDDPFLVLDDTVLDAVGHRTHLATDAVPVAPAGRAGPVHGRSALHLRWHHLAERTVGGFGPRQGEELSASSVQPTRAAWATFDAALQDIGVWGWPAQFTSPEGAQMDGTAWSLTITAADGRTFTSGGYNAFPPRFRELTAALATLATLAKAP